MQRLQGYDPVKAGIDHDLALRQGPIEPALATVDPILAHPIQLTPREFSDLLALVRDRLGLIFEAGLILCA